MNNMRLVNWLKMAGLSICLLFCSCAHLPPSQSSPVSYQHIVRQNPNYSIYVVQIRLNDPRVSVRVSPGGPDPDGDGPWLTTLLPASEIAAREHFDIAINGDFFVAEATKDIEGRNTGFIKGKFARPVGVAMTDGQLWHRPTNAIPYLEITSDHIAKIVTSDPSAPIDPTARQIIGGWPIIERDGKAVLSQSKFAVTQHPRTVIGIDKTGACLTLLVVDGRQPELSIGMDLEELSNEMIRLGCYSALNLDGGGSTTLVYRNPLTSALEVKNSPSDGKERSVADVLGVTVKALLPQAK